MGFLVRERFCDMDAQPNSNSEAFDQDVLASSVWALARIRTFIETWAAGEMKPSPFSSAFQPKQGTLEFTPMKKMGFERLANQNCSEIPSLVGAFGLKVIKCGAGSSLSTSSASRKGDQGDLDFRYLLYGGRSLSYQECFEEAMKMDWIERRCLYFFFIDRIPIICSLFGEGDKREGPNMFYPQPPYVISNLNLLFLFTSTMRATTSSPLLVREKASAQGLMKSQQLVRTRFWLAPFFLLGSRAISFLSVGLFHLLEQVREPRVNELKEPHDRIVHRLCIWMCIKKGWGRGREREEAVAAPHELLTGAVDLTRILDLIFYPTPVNDAIGEVFLLSFFINAGPVEIGGEWQSLVDLPLNESWSSQQSGLGSRIPSLVGAFSLKVIKCGADSSLSTSSASREGDRGDLDFRYLLYGERSLSYQECFEEAGKTDWIERRCLYLFFIDRIPIICSLFGEGDKREGPNMFYPQPPYVISNLNLLFLFTSTMHATTSSPLLVREKASAQRLMKSQQLVRTRFWLAPFFLLGSRAISFLSVGLFHPLEQVREPRVNELKEPHDQIVHRLCIWMCIKKGWGRGREREEAAVAPHELLTGALMLRISLMLQAALLSIFCRLLACSADLRGFQSPITCLFSAAITVSFPGSDSFIRSTV
uniref:Uncharacterized protein n=1 Tax=Tanacetum cinerariifolium TaxID=118510 RepID=A0A6L2N7A2_TANCI|nr:hypothetical protein [Tanacetum cinerariifolium]